MEMILYGFVALTIIVLFFGTTMASLIGKLVEEDSDKIIQEAQQRDMSDAYRNKYQQIPRHTRSSLPSPRAQSRTFVNRRHATPTRTQGF